MTGARHQPCHQTCQRRRAIAAHGVCRRRYCRWGIDALNNSDKVFVADFLRELFGNIARYADSTQRYVVLVSAAQDRVTIDVTDRPRQGDATFEGAAFRACVLSGACAACARGLGCAGETRAVGTACFSAGR